MTKADLTTLATAQNINNVVVDFTYVLDGTDVNGFNRYKIVYTNPPLSYKLVALDATINCAVLLPI